TGTRSAPGCRPACPTSSSSLSTTPLVHCSGVGRAPIHRSRAASRPHASGSRSPSSRTCWPGGPTAGCCCGASSGPTAASGVGAGPLGRDDGKLMLFMRRDAGVLRAQPAGDRPASPEHDRLREILTQRGACFFRELAGADDAESLEALWDLVWAGEVTNDSFAPLRALTARKSRSSSSSRRGKPNLGSLSVLGPPRAQGRWSLVDADLPADDSSSTERSMRLASVLLDRHGVLTRESVRGEGHAGGF